MLGRSTGLLSTDVSGRAPSGPRTRNTADQRLNSSSGPVSGYLDFQRIGRFCCFLVRGCLNCRADGEGLDGENRLPRVPDLTGGAPGIPCEG